MAQSKPVLTHVTYMPKKGKEKELGELVKKHWPVAAQGGADDRRAGQGLAGARPSLGPHLLHRALLWIDADAPRVAHQLPEVMAVWEPMGNIMEGYNGTQSPIAIAQLEPLA